MRGRQPPGHIWVHEDDRAEAAGSLDVAGTFGGREMIDDDLEVIPTPGHTAGTVSYLWDNGAHRFLFTGDLVWIEHGEWKAVVLTPELRRDELDSLALVREIDFDVLVPWGATDEGPSCTLVADRSEVRRRIDAIIDRVRSGGDR